MITRRNFFTKAAAAAAGTAVVSSLAHSARADEPVNSRRQDPAKSTGYDPGDVEKNSLPVNPAKTTLQSSHQTGRRSLIRWSEASKYFT